MLWLWFVTKGPKLDVWAQGGVGSERTTKEKPNAGLLAHGKC